MSDPNLTTLDNAALAVGRSPKTLRNYIADGRLTGYKIHGQRGLYIDTDEARRLFPPRHGTYGPKARIKTVVRPVVVPREEQR